MRATPDKSFSRYAHPYIVYLLVINNLTNNILYIYRVCGALGVSAACMKFSFKSQILLYTTLILVLSDKRWQFIATSSAR